jgi:hypothetical protein
MSCHIISTLPISVDRYVIRVYLGTHIYRGIYSNTLIMVYMGVYIYTHTHYTQHRIIFPWKKTWPGRPEGLRSGETPALLQRLAAPVGTDPGPLKEWQEWQGKAICQCIDDMFLGSVYNYI